MISHGLEELECDCGLVSALPATSQVTWGNYLSSLSLTFLIYKKRLLNQVIFNVLRELRIEAGWRPTYHEDCSQPIQIKGRLRVGKVLVHASFCPPENERVGFEESQVLDLMSCQVEFDRVSSQILPDGFLHGNFWRCA